MDLREIGRRFVQNLGEWSASLRTTFWLAIDALGLLLLSVIFSAIGFVTDSLIFLATAWVLILGAWAMLIAYRRERRK